MNRITSLSLVILLTATAFLGLLIITPQPVEAQGLADSPWPCYQGNAQHTGLSLYDTDHIDGTIKWSYPTGDIIYTTPAIGIDGTIYFGSSDNNLYAIYPNGTLKWSFTAGDNIWSSPAIDSDNTIYFGSDDNKFYALYPNGSIKWTYPVGDVIWCSPVIDDTGTIYFGSDDSNLYALYPNGTLKWSNNLVGRIWSSPAIDDEGIIYVGAGIPSLKIYSFYPNGTEKWSYSTEGVVISSPTIGDDGIIYFGGQDNNIYALYPNGTEKWNYTAGDTMQSSPGIGPDGTIYIGSYDNNLYAMYPNGTLKWTFPTGDNILSSPAIGSEGTIYFGSYDDKFYAIYPNGTEKWSYTTGGDIYSSPAIGADGKVYVGSHDFNLYAFGSNLEAPSAPQNLAASAGTGYVDLTWDQPTSNGNSSITNFLVYRGTSPGSESFLIEIGNVTTYNDTSVTNGIQYYYRIKAKNIIGEGPMSNEADDMPTGLPTVPQSLQATWGDSYVDLSWSAPNSNGGSAITNYEIYRGTTSGGETFLIEIGNLLTYNDATVTNGNEYFYKVSAKNALGESPQSNEVKGTPGLPTAPIGLAVDGGSSYANLTWSAPSIDGGFPITNYEIYRGISSGSLSLLTEIGNLLYYNDTSVSSGTTYYYQVSAKNSVGEGSKSGEVNVLIASLPTEPENLLASVGNGYVNLTWDPPSDDGGSPITNYRIYKGTTSGGESFLIQIDDILFYNDTIVTNGVTSYYQVSAKNAAWEGLLSEEVQGTPIAPPSEPLNLQSSAGDGYVNLTWDAPIDDGGSAVTNYRIYKGNVSGSENFLVEIGAVTFYNDSDVTNGVTYYYKVSARNAAGEGSQSTGTDATPVGLPTAPQNLQVSTGDGYIYLTWEAPLDVGGSEITNYRIYRDNTFLVEIGNVTSYNNTGLINGQAYVYNVSAKNTVGEGVLSTEISGTPVPPATVPSAPQNLQGTAGDGQVVLTWEASSSDGGSAITGYKIYRGSSAGNLTLLTLVGNVLTYTDSSVTNGQTYYYKVSAVNGVGESTQTSEVSGTPQAVTTNGDGGGDNQVMLIALLAIIAVIVIVILVALMKKKKPKTSEVPKEEEEALPGSFPIEEDTTSEDGETPQTVEGEESDEIESPQPPEN